MSSSPQNPPQPPQPAPTDALTIAERDALIVRLQTAWKNLPLATQQALMPTLNDGHQQFADFINNGTPPAHNTQMTLRLKSYISNDVDFLLARMGHPLNLAATQPLAAPIPAQAIVIGTSPDGSILGTGQYQQLDLRWELIAGSVWLEHLLFKSQFPPNAPDSPEPIPGNISIALISDFGTGNFGPGDSPAVKISKFLKQPKNQPTYAIHLGDVYYAGLGDEESNNFLTYWPQGSSASFALNSNHDMYSGGGPYFNQVVGGPVFNKLQSPWSFFALENPDWMIIGLDSAYYSSGLELYLNGTLGDAANAQTSFLRRMAQRAANDNRKVILLTHHNPIELQGPANTNQLYTDVMNALSGLPTPAYWYFGHEHVGAAYAGPPTANMFYRFLGHGALPWGQSSLLATAKANNLVDWYEDRPANDPNDSLRVYNGFVLLELNGPSLKETFYDENGNIAWTP